MYNDSLIDGHAIVVKTTIVFAITNNFIISAPANRMIFINCKYLFELAFIFHLNAVIDENSFYTQLMNSRPN